MVPFAKELVGGIKDELRAMKAGTVPAQLARTGFSLRPFAKQLIECLATRMRYPAGDLSPPDELEFADARRLVKQEFVNLARHAPEQVLEFFRDHIVPKVRVSHVARRRRCVSHRALPHPAASNRTPRRADCRARDLGVAGHRVGDAHAVSLRRGWRA